MAGDSARQTSAQPAASKPLSLIPVGLKEAALDSPTFRATVVHFGEQIDVVEKWLENYLRSAGRLSNEMSGIENIINTYLSHSIPPPHISEAILDHDYTALALKRYNEGAKEFWSTTLKWMKKVESTVIDPIKHYMQTELAGLKNYRRLLELSQRNFDAQIARYASQSKAKEPSALREDAFQLHEARKAYLKASMDFCTAAPQARAALDKLLVNLFAARWRDMKNSRDALASTISKWSNEIDRVRGWSKEMEGNERVFRRELQEARKRIEQTAEASVKPSRELDDYSKSTVAYLGQAPDIRQPAKRDVAQKTYKQGWLFQRTIQGKPARTVWVRRWFYVKHGIFGWLANNARTGAVEESEKTGVLLCGVRPSFQDERRFCFEVKTKDSSVELQAETQLELMEWIQTFEVAKRKALENPASTEAIAAGAKSVDAAFAISPPIAAEFAAKHPEVRDDDAPPERSATLGLEPVPSHISRSTTDVTGRKSFTDSESTRERMLHKLDLHRKVSGSPAGGPAGIAGLISASHSVLPLGGAPTPSLGLSADFKAVLGKHIPPSSLAPSTLANPPTPTNLSKTAIAICGEKDLSPGTAVTDGGLPGGIMANVWGSNNWGFLNRQDRGEVKSPLTRRRSMSQPPAPTATDLASAVPMGDLNMTPTTEHPPSAVKQHRKTISMSSGIGTQSTTRLATKISGYPGYYPLALKAQDAQFRTLFPEVRREDKVVLVFMATWAPNDQQEFPGRVYVTTSDLYFYSHHLGLVMISGVNFDAINEITAAPGKDNDFIFLHVRPDMAVDGATRITLKTYLDSLKVLDKRLNYLLRNADSDDPDSLEEVIKTLIQMESSASTDSPNLDEWEDVSVNTPVDGAKQVNSDKRAGLRIDGTLFPETSKQIGKNAAKFRLPAHPVNYTPQGMSAPLVEREFDITAKALFHVLAGDKSAVFQSLNIENGAENVLQGPWTQTDTSLHLRREFKYNVSLGKSRKEAVDTQIIDVFNDHLCYVITERRTPWSLPYAPHFSIISKLVVTHVAKSRCRFAVYAKVEFRRRLWARRSLLEKAGLENAAILAKGLTDILTDQVAQLGTAGKNSAKAIQAYGNVGQSKETTSSSLARLPRSSRERLKPLQLSHLILRAARTKAKNALLAVIGALIFLAQAFAKTASAHSLLVVLLTVSGFANLYSAKKDGLDWYRDRKAKAFMRSIGVAPNVGMGHSIWLRDLDSLALPTLLSSFATSAANLTDQQGTLSPATCRGTFNALIAQTDPASPLVPGGAASGKDGDSNTLARLQKTRYRYGSYRHDLLVALKVIERVERETVKAEWESWVRGEVGKCRATRAMLRQKGGGSHLVDADDEVYGAGEEAGARHGDAKPLRDWWEGYCGSCEEEARAAHAI